MLSELHTVARQPATLGGGLLGPGLARCGAVPQEMNVTPASPYLPTGTGGGEQRAFDQPRNNRRPMTREGSGEGARFGVRLRGESASQRAGCWGPCGPPTRGAWRAGSRLSSLWTRSRDSPGPASGERPRPPTRGPQPSARPIRAQASCPRVLPCTGRLASTPHACAQARVLVPF